MSALWDQHPVNGEPEKTRRGAEALLFEREPLASPSHACPAVGSTLGDFCCSLLLSDLRCLITGHSRCSTPTCVGQSL